MDANTSFSGSLLDANQHQPIPLPSTLNIDNLKTEALLLKYATPGIVAAFRRMLESIEQLSSNSVPPLSEDATEEEVKERELKVLKPSAIAYGELEDLFKGHLRALSWIRLLRYPQQPAPTRQNPKK